MESTANIRGRTHVGGRDGGREGRREGGTERGREAWRDGGRNGGRIIHQERIFKKEGERKSV